MTLELFLWCGLLATILLGSLLLVANATAQTPPACPAGPATGTTGEDAVHELRELRREQAQACAALRERLVVIGERVDASAGAIVDSTVISRNEQVGRDRQNPAYVVETGPTGSTGSTGPQEVKLAHEDTDRLDQNMTAVRSDVWFLVGALLSAPFGFFFLRTVLP